jgi:hypothetical protein
MSPSLEYLFQNHVADLRDIDPSSEGGFICPICKKVYSFADIKNKKLTRGHIWPDYIREKSSGGLAKKHIVLLCENCNSRAGQYGDSQMQLFQQIQDGDEKGDIYGKRKVQIADQDGNPLIKINANVKKDKDTKAITLSWKRDNKDAWIGNDHRMKERFEGLLGKTEPLSISIDANPIKETEPRPELAPVGWITSAYLFAFYTFGYRYILHPMLDPIREYILSSFDKEQSKNLKMSYPSFGLQEDKNKFTEAPTIEIIISLEPEVAYLQIHLFTYQIKLPFHYVPIALSAFVHLQMPDINERLPELKKSGDLIYFEIVNHSKVHCAECPLDYVLGKPVPAQT